MASSDLSLQQCPAEENSTHTLGCSLETDSPFNVRSFRHVVAQRKINIAQVVLRLLCMASSAMALSFMVTAHEASTLVLYGFQIPVQSEWSYSSSFQYLVVAVTAVAAHSLLQLLITVSGVLRKSSIVSSRNFGWLLFAADQVLAYTLISAGSAASGVTNLNRTGIKHAPLPNFCKPLQSFCNHVALSIVFAFLSCVLLAASVVLDVICLSNPTN